MEKILKNVLEYHYGLLYESTAMALELICETLCYNHGKNATWQGRSIYIDDKRVASIKTCKEGEKVIAIYDYKIIA